MGEEESQPESPRRPRPFPGHRFALGLLGAVLLVWASLFALGLHEAALPPQRAGMVTVVFPPGFDAREMMARVVRADGRAVRETMFDNIWVVQSDRGGFVGRLEAAGAWAAFDPAAFDPVDVAGCFLLPLRSSLR